jgi:soluble lytic murein transglycosylase-like protein
MSRRSDGVYVFSNNPDKPRPPMVGTVGMRQPGRRFGQALVAPAFLRERINDHALAQDLDPKLVEALIRVESAFNSRAVSNKGAMGLMQLMPGTALELGVEDAFDVEENLRGGTAYLRSLIDRFSGDLTLALAGYNAGPAAVEKYSGVPPYRETTDYVRRVLAAYGAPAAKNARRSSSPGTMSIRLASPPAAAPAAARVATGAGR